jgi:NADPH:quinone reductase-like Zn-dependent oxidoreductase
MPKVYVYNAFGGPETQEFVDLPVPVAGDGELLVGVRFAGVNPADWKRRANYRRSPDPFPGPTPMGLELAGVVEAVGPGVSGFAVGDEVFGTAARNGAWSEYSILSVDQAALVPAGVSLAAAATLPVAAATAYDAIVQIAPTSGDVILITGAGGGVGIAGVQIAIATGTEVIGTASDAKRELIESLGARHVAYGPGEDDRVRALAPGGLDALFDNVGGESLRALAPLVKDRARLVTAGDVATASEFGGVAVARARNAAVLEKVATLVAEGTLDPFVTETFPLARVGEALALVEDGHATGKVVVEID